MKKQSKKEQTDSSPQDSDKPTAQSESNLIASDNLFDDEELSGYPHYPASEDIMNPVNNMEKKELSEENFSQQYLSASRKKQTSKKEENKSPAQEDETDEEEIMNKNEETDVTREDLITLGSDELNADDGDDDQLRRRSVPVDMSGDDLDVPGSELDDEEEMIGEEDEENNSYSIGGDRHDDLEENGPDTDDKF